MDLDVLAVQEVEDIEALKDFVRFHLVALYPNIALIEGNDTRFIDVACPSSRSPQSRHAARDPPRGSIREGLCPRSPRGRNPRLQTGAAGS
jgi:hypothetical protein